MWVQVWEFGYEDGKNGNPPDQPKSPTYMDGYWKGDAERAKEIRSLVRENDERHRRVNYE